MRLFFLSVWDVLLKFGGALTAVFSGIGNIRALCILIAADYATGLICGVLRKSKKTTSGGLSAKAGFQGLLKKAVIFVVLFAAALADEAAGGQTGLLPMTVGFYIVNESISILENAACMGVPIPQKLRQMLDVMRAEKG